MRGRDLLQLRPFPVISGQRGEARVLCHFHFSVYPALRERPLDGEPFLFRIRSRARVLGSCCLLVTQLFRTVEKVPALSFCPGVLWQTVRRLGDMVQAASPPNSQRPTGVTLSYMAEMRLNLSGLYTAGGQETQRSQRYDRKRVSSGEKGFFFFSHSAGK